MGIRATKEYAGQAWTVAGFSIVACSVALAAVGVGLWLSIYTKNFAVIVGAELRNVFIGYASLGGFMFVCGLFGVFVALIRQKQALLVYAVLLLANLVCYGDVWAFMYIQRQKISNGLLESIEENAQPNTFLVHYLSQQFNCSLTTLEQPYDTTLLGYCRDDIDKWLQSSVWILLGISIALMTLQLFLMVTSLMLRHMVAELLERSQLKIMAINERKSEERQRAVKEAWLQEPILKPSSEQGPIKTHKISILDF